MPSRDDRDSALLKTVWTVLIPGFFLKLSVPFAVWKRSIDIFSVTQSFTSNISVTNTCNFLYEF